MIKPAINLQDLRRKIYLKAKSEPTHRFWGLYVHIIKLETLRQAYAEAKANHGAPGIDDITFADIEQRGVEEFLQQIQKELQDGTYRPRPLKHVHIPKDNGKTRKLSIPTIRDRVVQGAVKLILEAIFEADFQDNSYGYRPKRHPHQAIHRVAQGIWQGMTQAIDVDLSSYFDHIRHHLLLEKIAQRIDDPNVMRLLKQILKANGKRGVSQGGVLSPLLSNVYLNAVDQVFAKAQQVTRTGKQAHLLYTRYADDILILIAPHPQYKNLLQHTYKRLKEELDKLQVSLNEEKTKVVDLQQKETFGFLGFVFRLAQSRRGKPFPLYRPKLKKRTQLLRKVKTILQANRHKTVSQVIQEINPVIAGWVNYFRIGHAYRDLCFVRDQVEKKVRAFAMRQRNRMGFGWKRWSRQVIYKVWGLYKDYQIRHYLPEPKARLAG